MFGHTHKKRVKKNNNHKRLLETKEDDEAYLLVIKALGHCSFTCENKNTGKEVFAKTAGRLTHGPQKKFIKPGDLVLAEIILLNINKEEYMIKMVYTPDEMKKLADMGELTNMNINPDDNNKTVLFEKDVMADISVDDSNFNFDEI